MTIEPKVGAECGSPARSDLCGGRPEAEAEGPSLPRSMFGIRIDIERLSYRQKVAEQRPNAAAVSLCGREGNA